MFVGSWLSGFVVDHYKLASSMGTVEYDWRSIWLFSAACSTAVLLIFLFTFSDREADTAESLPIEQSQTSEVPL